jgi:hypothetical protein
MADVSSPKILSENGFFEHGTHEEMRVRSAQGPARGPKFANRVRSNEKPILKKE